GGAWCLCGDPYSLARSGPGLWGLQSLKTLRPGYLDRGRRLPARAARREGRRVAGGLWGLGGARDAGAQCRRRGEEPAVGAGLARRYRCLAGARLHADRGPPWRRGLSLARGGRPVAPLPARNVFGGAHAGGGAMSDVTERIRGAVHAALGHHSALAHLTGAARYLDDVPIVSGTLEAALVLCPHSHARIRRVDLSAALAAPGVLAAITAADIPGKND